MLFAPDSSGPFSRYHIDSSGRPCRPMSSQEPTKTMRPTTVAATMENFALFSPSRRYRRGWWRTMSMRKTVTTNSTMRLVRATSGAPRVSMIQDTAAPAIPTRITEPNRDRVEMIAMTTSSTIARPARSPGWSMPSTRGGRLPIWCRPSSSRKAAPASSSTIAKIQMRWRFGLSELPGRLARRPHRLASWTVSEMKPAPVNGSRCRRSIAAKIRWRAKSRATPMTMTAAVMPSGTVHPCQKARWEWWSSTPTMPVAATTASSGTSQKARTQTAGMLAIAGRTAGSQNTGDASRTSSSGVVEGEGTRSAPSGLSGLSLSSGRPSTKAPRTYFAE